MQTDANISSSKHTRIIIDAEPHKPDGNTTETHTGDTFFILLAQRASTRDDYKQWDAATLPVAKGVKEKVERFVRGPTGAGDEEREGGKIGMSGAKFGSEGVRCVQDCGGILGTLE